MYVTESDKQKSSDIQEMDSGLAVPSFAADTIARVRSREAKNSLPFALPLGLAAGLCVLGVLTFISVSLLTSPRPAIDASTSANASSFAQATESSEASQGSSLNQSMAKLRVESGVQRNAVASTTASATSAMPSGKSGAPVPIAAPSPTTAFAPSQRPAQSEPATSGSSRPSPAVPTSLVWPEVWQLPDAASLAAETLTTLPDEQAIVRLGVKSPISGMRMGLGSAGQTGIVLQPDSATNPKSWTASYQSNNQTGGEREMLAAFQRSGHDLLFKWETNQPSAEARRELANCLLEISSNQSRRYAQLRKPTRAETIQLDLSAESQNVELQIDDPPQPDGLRLEINELTGFSSEPAVRGGLKMAALPAGNGTRAQPVPQEQIGQLPGMGIQQPAFQPQAPQSLVIEFTDIPGFEIRVRFIRAEQPGRLALSIEPVYRESQKEFDLRAAKQLEDLESEYQVVFAKAQRAMPTAEAKLNRALADEKKHKGIQPLASEKKRFDGWQNKQRQIANAISKNESEVKSLQKPIEMHQARVDAVTKIRNFIKASDGKATIGYVVYLECGQPDLLVVDARWK